MCEKKSFCGCHIRTKHTLLAPASASAVKKICGAVLKPPINQAFGKLERSLCGEAFVAWHPLVDHMTDVAICFEVLCSLPSFRRSMTALAGRVLSGQVIQRLAALAFLHDFGKANSSFQSKRWTGMRLPDGWPTPAGHGLEGLLLLTRTNIFPRAEELASLLPLAEMSEWGSATYSLLLASISHHGRPVVDIGKDVAKTIWQPTPDFDPAVELKRITSAVKSLYPRAFEAGGDELPSAAAFSHYFAGMVQLADWLGSDTRFFRYSEPSEQRTETAYLYARRAVTEIGLDVSKWRNVIARHSPKFADTFIVPAPRPMQAQIGDTRFGQLVIIEAETGSGKTEAALWRYLKLFSSGAVDSLYFALPTRVSASQIYSRILTVSQRLWPDNPPTVVRALPGYVAADDATASLLPHFRLLWADQPSEQRAHLRWAAETPKRYLASPIAVGTIDQALLGILQTSHAHLRQSLLARSLLVVDEVHASDPYMTVLLERLLSQHLSAGGHAVLLSATLGATARDRYLAIARCPHHPDFKTMSLNEAIAVSYPAVWDATGLHAVSSDNREKIVSWRLSETIDSPEQIAKHAITAIREGAKVLIIRNTVPSAVATVRALEAAGITTDTLLNVNGRATLHHSRFSREDRPLLDAAVEQLLGKHRYAGACVVVGTQTLEQSLDIDADYLMTDLCPIDVLLQRIGRLHRHRRPAGERPAAFARAQVLVLAPQAASLERYLQRPQHGLGRFRDGGGVYADLRVIEATRRLIESNPSISIPADNRRLVEAGTHTQALEQLATICGPDWVAHGQQISGDTGARQTVGRLQTIDVTQAFENTRFDPDQRIATRLGAQDRLLTFPEGTVGPFGTPLLGLPVRHHLLPEHFDPDAQPTDLIQINNELNFTLGKAQYRYGRFGLERLSIPALSPEGGTHANKVVAVN